MRNSYLPSTYVSTGVCCRCGRQATERDKLIVRRQRNWGGTRVIEWVCCPNAMQCAASIEARIADTAFHALAGD